jgi:glycosyltransferase involved in cell wall biosynthesis
MKVSVIVTVLNEGPAIRRLMDSLGAQTRPPDEVVVCDGGSTDDTLAVLREYQSRLPLRVIVRPGANISQGRNEAIAAASGDVIASTDAGVWLEPAWLEALVAPLQADSALPAVAGWFVADPQTSFELAMGATVLPHQDEIDPDQFLPSSRSVAFRKSAWQAAGGYPEWLDYCEDLIFDFWLRAQGGSIPFAPAAVAHFRPRSSLRAFWLQYFRYARGDGKADLWRGRHAVRYATYLLAGPWLLTRALRGKWWAMWALVAGAAAYLRTPYWRLVRVWRPLRPSARAQAAAWVPLIRVVGDVAKMVGYPVGLVWRWRNRHRAEVHWRR